MMFVNVFFNPETHGYEFSVAKNLKDAEKVYEKMGNKLSFIGECHAGKCTTIMHTPEVSDGGYFEFWLVDAFLQGLSASK